MKFFAQILHIIVEFVANILHISLSKGDIYFNVVLTEFAETWS